MSIFRTQRFLFGFHCKIFMDRFSWIVLWFSKDQQHQPAVVTSTPSHIFPLLVQLRCICRLWKSAVAIATNIFMLQAIDCFIQIVKKAIQIKCTYCAGVMNHITCFGHYYFKHNLSILGAYYIVTQIWWLNWLNARSLHFKEIESSPKVNIGAQLECSYFTVREYIDKCTFKKIYGRNHEEIFLTTFKNTFCFGKST